MSSARVRQQKRKGKRAPGILRQGQPGYTSSTEAPEHSVRNEFSVSWRMFSGGITAALLLVLVAFFAADAFYVRGITLQGADYLDESEVFRYADIAEKHVFWVSPDSVRQSIMDATPLVADVQVDIGWPPDLVTITVDEREPALLWTQAGVRVLIDVRGHVLRSPPDDETFPDLMHVIADSSFDSPRLPGDPVPLPVVTGTLQLQNIIAGLPNLRYNAEKGLGFREQDGEWDVWLGTGTNMPNKLSVYEELRDDLLARGITPVEINVADLNAVYYCRDASACYE